MINFYLFSLCILKFFFGSLYLKKKKKKDHFYITIVCKILTRILYTMKTLSNKVVDYGLKKFIECSVVTTPNRKGKFSY